MKQILANLRMSSRSEVDRAELYERIALHSDIHFTSEQVSGLPYYLPLDSKMGSDLCCC